eukprot:gnl/TRDRNA2_/TRDRNA2_118370_c0_seq1.p1 gnl/TRDRNA2_/TRDRNA2_118370_c0~~gnl/TRDRNA2_/TRDRNA2_118370_c0_seq1.p1  ORF type:complete len:324 (+),score=54.13 gnl/TRDRNA2_/TRDRNA2_118370_c0_seq1:137-973(+)
MKAKGVLPQSQAQMLSKHLIQGLSFLHSKRIVHRDIKPANCLLKSGATVLKIGDFISARKVEDGEADRGVRVGSLVLSPKCRCAYMAPELIFNSWWNEMVDIWAGGLTIYYMFRGELPFHAKDALVAKTLLLGSLPLGICWDGISDTFKGLVEQCLTVDIRSRATAEELLRHPAFHNAVAAELVKTSSDDTDMTEESTVSTLESVTMPDAVLSLGESLANVVKLEGKPFKGGRRDRKCHTIHGTSLESYLDHGCHFARNTSDGQTGWWGRTETVRNAS